MPFLGLMVLFVVKPEIFDLSNLAKEGIDPTTLPLVIQVWLTLLTGTATLEEQTHLSSLLKLREPEVQFRRVNFAALEAFFDQKKYSEVELTHYLVELIHSTPELPTPNALYNQGQDYIDRLSLALYFLENGANPRWINPRGETLSTLAYQKNFFPMTCMLSEWAGTGPR